MKTFLFASALCAGILCSCSSDDNPTAPNATNGFSPEGRTTFAMLPQSNAPKMGGKQLLTSMTHDKGGVGKFRWSSGDHLWVERSAGIWVKDASNNIPAAGAATAVFSYTGTYSNATYNVLYNGNPTSATDPTQVVIPTTQTQTTANDFSHLGASGDCGYATATKNSDNMYDFNLTHAATYLAFLPRTTDAKLTGGKVTRIDITSTGSDGIAGTFTLGSTGLSGSSTDKVIQLNAGTSGFALNSTNEIANQSAYYAVIAPGSHQLKAKYYVTASDGMTQYKVNKVINTSTTNYGANKIYDITANLKAMPDGLEKYYTWDAQTNKYYWADETGITIIYPEVEAPNQNSTTAGSGYPTTSTDSRWYNTAYVGDGVTRSTATNSAKDCPTYNQISWYLWAHTNGLPIYWDNTTQWSHFGGIYTGGIWLPKKDKVMALSGYTGDSDMNSSYSGTQSITPTAGKPTNESDYFFLPALGGCGSGGVFGVGQLGYCWSSESNEWVAAGYAWYLYFYSGSVSLHADNRDFGFTLWAVQ